MESFWAFLTSTEWWAYLVRIGLFFLAALLLHKISRRLARRFILLRFFSRRGSVNPMREETLNTLVASGIAFIGYFLASIASLNQFVGADTLLWVIGLFSAAFGLGARPLISDLLTGLGFLFADSFSVGEKIEVSGVEGVVEAVNLLTTLVRSSTGELYTIPNGEIRVIRNFSRGRFSVANIVVRIETRHLKEALTILEKLGLEAVQLLPDLVEPWKVISANETVGETTELMLVAHAKYGMAAELRPRLFTLVHERLAEAGISPAG